LKIVNESPFIAGWTSGFEKDGREVAVVAVKASYKLRPVNGASPELCDEQTPLIEADQFGPDPSTDAPVRENDFSLFKPACDVLAFAQAYAPRGQPAPSFEVALEVGACRKSFRVVGRRQWVRSLGTVTSTRPIPFVTQQISYDVAFGGTEADPSDPKHVKTFLRNPAGIGYRPFKANIDQAPLPLTENLKEAVSDPVGDYVPMALGPVGRNWHPRYTLAGTYDAKWLDNKLPFLPDDFDFRYFQAAAADQQIPYPLGGEPIVLSNLAAEGELRSSIPREGVVISFINKNGKLESKAANLDTVVLEPDSDRMFLTWRAVHRLSRDFFELGEMLVELKSRHRSGLARAHAHRKPFFENLGDFVKYRRQGRS
jgi:hypothetical protein